MVESKASGICFSAWTTIVQAESSDVTVFGTLEPVEGLQLSGEGLDRKFYLISVLGW